LRNLKSGTIAESLQSEISFRQAIEKSIPSGIVVVDDTGKQVYVNQSFCNLFGWDESELLEKLPPFLYWSIQDFENINNAFQQTIINNAPKEGFDLIFCHKTGKLFPVNVIISPFQQENKKTFFLANVIDITERKKSEGLIAYEKQRLKDIIEGTDVGTWEWNIQTGETIFNERWAEFIGYTLEELSPINIDTWIKYTHPEDLKVSDELLEKHFKGELDYYTCEERMKHKNGNWIWVLVRGKVHKWDEKGKPLLMSGTHQNITERKQTEMALKEREQEFRNLAESMPQIVWTTDAAGLNNYFNQQWVGYTGMTLEESYGHGWNTPFHPDDQKHAWEAWQNAVINNAEYSIESRLRCHDGTYHWWLVRGVPQIDEHGKILKWFGTCTDIEKIKYAENELRKSEEKFRNLFNNSEVGMFRTRLDGSEILEFNEKYLKILGYTYEEVRDKPSKDIWANEHQREKMTQIIKAEGHLADFECEILNKHGDVINCITSLRLYSEIGILEGSIQDITERKMSEKKLHDANQFNLQVINSAGEGIIVYGPDMKYQVWNPYMENLSGLPASEVIGKKPLDLFPFLLEAGVIDCIERALKGEIPGSREFPFTQPGSGRNGWTLDITYPLRNANGKVIGAITTVCDITERKMADERFRTILNTTIDGFYLVDIEGRILDTNDSYCAMIGYSRKELLKMKVKDIEAVDTEEVIKKRIQQILETGYARFETKHLRKDGRVISVEASVNYLKVEQQKFFCFMRDISDRKEAEEKLIEKESDLNHAQKIAHVGSWKLDTKTQMPSWSENMYHIFGLNPENGPLDYQGHKRIIFPDDWVEFDNAVQLASRTGADYKLKIRIMRPNGELRWIITESETKKDHEGNVVELLGICQDITDSKLLEDELRKREAQYSTILQTAVDGFWVTDLQGNFLDINESYCQLIGYSRDELLSMSISDVEVLGKKTEIKQHIQRIIKNGSDRFERKHRCKEGNVVDLEISVNYLSSEGKLCVFLHNITARNLRKAELQEASLYTRNLIESGLDPLVTINAHGKITDVNKATEKITGFRRNKLIGSDFADYFTKPHMARKGYKTVFLNGFVKDYPLSIINDKGQIRDVLYNATLFKNIKGEVQGVFAAARDITDRKKLEEELSLSKDLLEKLNHHLVEVRENERALIARDIHDQLGQSLTALKLDINRMQEFVTHNQRAMTMLNGIVEMVTNTIVDVKRITADLRPGIIDDLGLVSAIDWYCSEFSERTGIKCRLRLNDEISCDPQQTLVFFRVLQEALTNVIRHANATLVKIGLYRSAKGVKLTITDNGIGISREQAVSGKSLGLIGIRERIKQFKGRFDISSEDGNGTKLTVYIPNN
jgi:PAS domain S-box-containing protein